jgi:ATP/maltotriose-dependent transcriptional regulator MalT
LAGLFGSLLNQALRRSDDGRARCGKPVDEIERRMVGHQPAGFGKTTLLHQWARREADKPAWVSLDARDNDPACFWRYVIEALPLAPARVLLLVQASQASRIDTPYSHTRHFVRDLDHSLNELPC